MDKLKIEEALLHLNNIKLVSKDFNEWIQNSKKYLNLLETIGF